MPTSSSCCGRAGSWSGAPTTSWSPAAASTPSCTGGNCWKRKWSAPRDGVGAHGVSTAAFNEDLVAKSYDRTLLRRLLTYLRPYKAAVAVSFLLIVVMAGLDLVGPYLTKVAIDRYIMQGDAPGLARVAGLYM